MKKKKGKTGRDILKQKFPEHEFLYLKYLRAIAQQKVILKKTILKFKAKYAVEDKLEREALQMTVDEFMEKHKKRELRHNI